MVLTRKLSVDSQGHKGKTTLEHLLATTDLLKAQITIDKSSVKSKTARNARGEQALD